MEKDVWDSLVTKYVKSIKADKNSDYAYERLVNTLSILSLCDNTGTALDLGCGDGRFTRELENRYEKVFAVDYSANMLKEANKYCKSVKFARHDLERPFPEFGVKFDLVNAKLLLMYIKNLDNIARESFKVLKKGGLFIASVTHPLKWVAEKQKGKLGEQYLGYLSEVKISGKIARDKNLSVVFFNRTLQTYVNTFTKHGFYLEAVLETGVPDTFVIKYPKYLEFQKKPYRLNMKFIRQ